MRKPEISGDLAIGRELADVLRVSLTDSPRPLSPSPGSAGGGTAQGILIARDGREVAIEENSSTIRDERGRVLGTVIAIRERTDLAQISGQTSASDRNRPRRS